MKTYQFMWRLIRYRPALYLANAVAWILIHISPVLPGLVIKEFFDTLSGQSQLGLGIWGLIALLVAIALARIANILVGFLTDSVHRFSMSALVRRNTLESILTTPRSGLAKSAGEVVNIFEEDGKQVEDAISWTVDMMGMASFALASAIILVRISPRLTLLVFLPLIIVVLVAQAASERLERYRKESREATAQVTEAIGEAFTTVGAIQVAGAVERVTHHLKGLGDRRRDAMLRDKLLSRILDSIFENTSRLGTGLILLLAARYMRVGGLGVGDFALFVYYLEYVTEFAAFFGYFTVHYKQTGVSLNRFASLVPRPQRLVEKNPIYLKGPLPKLHLSQIHEAEQLQTLRVSGLTAKHPDSENGVLDLSFTLDRGTFTVVTGRVGSGKSTLVGALLGLMPRESGEICWNGRPVGDPRSFFTPPRSAYTPQVPRLFSDTLKNNILLGIPEEEVDLEGAIGAAVLEEDLRTLEKGLETLIGPRGVKLSGGQQQRTAVARMLVRQAQLLVFDDVSSALDVETEKQLWESLAERSGVTSLVVSNRRAAILRADQVLVLKDGRILEHGRPQELLKTSSELRAILAESGEDH